MKDWPEWLVLGAAFLIALAWVVVTVVFITLGVAR